MEFYEGLEIALYSRELNPADCRNIVDSYVKEIVESKLENREKSIRLSYLVFIEVMWENYDYAKDYLLKSLDQYVLDSMVRMSIYLSCHDRSVLQDVIETVGCEEWNSCTSDVGIWRFLLKDNVLIDTGDFRRDDVMNTIFDSVYESQPSEINMPYLLDEIVRSSQDSGNCSSQSDVGADFRSSDFLMAVIKAVFHNIDNPHNITIYEFNLWINGVLSVADLNEKDFVRFYEFYNDIVFDILGIELNQVFASHEPVVLSYIGSQIRCLQGLVFFDRKSAVFQSCEVSDNICRIVKEIGRVLQHDYINLSLLDKKYYMEIVDRQRTQGDRKL